jgi:glycosyltransferase involved in cell wall biosynthesis
MGSIKLSILICTIPERLEKFNILIASIQYQASKLKKRNEIEVLFNPKPRGEITIGYKRNLLLKESKGDYVCFIDDDDSIPDYYIQEILNAIKEKKDCIGFEIDCNMEGVKQNAASSMKYDWSENKGGYKYVRSIYHKTPVKRAIAMMAMFPDISFGEDYEYSMRLKPLLKSETFIKKIMYFYNYKYENPKVKYGLK